MAAENISKEYEGEWKISTPTNPIEFKSILTPTFSPLSDSNVSFRFEAWYQLISHDFVYLSLFKLKLVKLSSACISPTLKVIVNVKVDYSDGCLFKEYSTLPSKNVHNMKEITFEDVISPIKTRAGKFYRYNTHYDKMQSQTLNIKCKMAFNDHNQNSHISIEMKRCNKYLELTKNLKSIYEPSTLSDFVFKVGDKTLPAHKAILAAHSPVFKNMMTHEFQESKTNSVTITDTTPEIFDLFLRYLYSGEMENKNWNSVRELFYLADKYDVGILKNECTDAAISLLSLDLVCGVLQVAYTYSDSRLKAAVKQFAIQNLKEIVLREEWKDLVTTHPMIGYEVTFDFISK